MRIRTNEEEKILNELRNPNLTKEEREEKILKLKEEEKKATNGETWLT